MISESEFAKILQKCKELPASESTYLEEDFICNLLLTVLDFQMQTKAVVNAMNFYRKNRWNAIRNLKELKALFDKYADDKEGNTKIAQFLWGYKLWTRVAFLRKLVIFFESIEVTTQENVKLWAQNSDYEKDFEGKIKGLGYAVYQWIVMRQGIETVKPDVHLRRFVESVVTQSFTDKELVDVLEKAACQLGIKAYELDWKIWEHQRNKQNL